MIRETLILFAAMVMYAVALANIEKNLYEDDNIYVTKEGVFSKRTHKRIDFKTDPNWVEEDFFTQQEKYCEKDNADMDK